MNDDRTIIDCTEAEARLQIWLDGSPRQIDARLKAHLGRCKTCRERFAAADELLRAFPVRLSSDFTSRMTLAVKRDHHRRVRQQYFVGIVSLAASVAIAIWLAMPPKPADSLAQTPPTPSLETQMARATNAVREWTGRTAQSIPIPDVRKVEILPVDGLALAIEPAAASLSDAGKGLAKGVEPLTNSAKRAATKFWRDLSLSD